MIVDRLWSLLFLTVPILGIGCFVWAIAGDEVVPDHAAGTVAVGPREAAKHFSMKWQMDADQMYRNAEQFKGNDKVGAEIRAHADRLVQSAELMYDLSEREAIWKPSQ